VHKSTRARVERASAADLFAQALIRQPQVAVLVSDLICRAR
jgi:hypothetical protein